jgi:hypothetical protein
MVDELARPSLLTLDRTITQETRPGAHATAAAVALALLKNDIEGVGMETQSIITGIGRKRV